MRRDSSCWFDHLCGFLHRVIREPLLAVIQAAAEIGQQAVELALAAIDGQDVSGQQRLIRPVVSWQPRNELDKFERIPGVGICHPDTTPCLLEKRVFYGIEREHRGKLPLWAGMEASMVANDETEEDMLKMADYQ